MKYLNVVWLCSNIADLKIYQSLPLTFQLFLNFEEKK